MGSKSSSSGNEGASPEWRLPEQEAQLFADTYSVTGLLGLEDFKSTSARFWRTQSYRYPEHVIMSSSDLPGEIAPAEGLLVAAADRLFARTDLMVFHTRHAQRRHRLVHQLIGRHYIIYDLYGIPQVELAPHFEQPITRMSFMDSRAANGGILKVVDSRSQPLVQRKAAQLEFTPRQLYEMHLGYQALTTVQHWHMDHSA